MEKVQWIVTCAGPEALGSMFIWLLRVPSPRSALLPSLPALTTTTTTTSKFFNKHKPRRVLILFCVHEAIGYQGLPCLFQFGLLEQALPYTRTLSCFICFWVSFTTMSALRSYNDEAVGSVARNKKRSTALSCAECRRYDMIWTRAYSISPTTTAKLTPENQNTNCCAFSRFFRLKLRCDRYVACIPPLVFIRNANKTNSIKFLLWCYSENFPVVCTLLDIF